jgi:hypothetical protein
VSFEGQYTSDVNIDASAAEMKAALESLSNVGTVLVTRFINGNGFRWVVSFTSLVGDLRLLEASANRYEI